MHSVIGDKFLEENTILLWKGRRKDLLLASKLIEIPKNYQVLDIDSKDKALVFDFKTVRKIKNICKPIALSSKEVQLHTSFASGIYFELLKSALSVKDEGVIQFDDGLINEIVVVNKYRFIRFVICLLHGFFCFPPKYRLFSDNRFNKIYTSMNSENTVSIECKQVVDISNDVSSNFYKISMEHIRIGSPKSAVLMTTHSVESGRMVRSEYHQLITDVYLKLRELGVKNVYLSKHPAEKNSNDGFYNKIGLILTYQDYPSELLIANKDITYIANPANSTIIMSDYFKHLDEIDAVVTYFPANSPYKDARIRMIDKVLSKYSAEHYVL